MGPHVVVAATEDLTAEQKSAVVAVCIAAHDNVEFEKLFSVYIPSGGRHFVAYHQSQIVSHAVVTTRWLQANGNGPLKTAFVDAVSTLPAAQGHGHASAVMRALASGIDDYDVGCLQTDIPEFYERLGWELWRGPLSGRNGGDLVATPDQTGVMVLRLPQTPALDLDGALSIEQQPSRIWN
jgi:aminoglycoside 2'-N-acetyltransferase I